jgi:hypothetical protein
MTNELRTNDEPQRILLEAYHRIRACYPNGTRVEALIHGERVFGHLEYEGLGHWTLRNGMGYRPFFPHAHPHRVLP